LPIVIERLLGRTGTVLQAQAYALSSILAAATIAVVLLLEPPGTRITGLTRTGADPAEPGPAARSRAATDEAAGAARR
jgi:hypothetical protein